MQHQEPEDSFMRHAIEVAKSNEDAPFGSVLVERSSGVVVAEGVNRAHENPLLHGEIDAINRYASSRRARWGELQLFTTAEPCCMCQAAILWSGITEVYFGTSIEDLQAMGWKQINLSARELTELADFANCRIVGGVLRAECDELFARAIAGRRAGKS